MLSRDMYTEQYIRDLQERTGNDPALLERVIYAFGLLEAICQVGLPFCFKGGTALMLLLDHPRRLSTDIDIIVEPGVDIDDYIRRAGEIFPFLSVEEQMRVGRNQIVKRHFQFRYQSPRSGHDVMILLDVVFDQLQYHRTIERAITNELLLTEGEGYHVLIPDVDSILGDKLTAFAPHTTGIPFGVGKELEIVKQLFDCGTLCDAIMDYDTVRETYALAVQSEMRYRGLELDSEEVLQDTIKGCVCVASRGLEGTDYPYYKDGISRIRNHIMGNKFSGEIAGAYAARVLYLAAVILTGKEQASLSEDSNNVPAPESVLAKPREYSYLRVVDRKGYEYLLRGSALLHEYSGYLV